MALKIKHDIPKQFLPNEAFEYDFAKARKSIGIEHIDMHNAEDTLAEEKYDGSRYGAEITEDVKIISRNGINRAQNIPYITKVLKDIFPEGTILDGEVVHIKAPRNKRWEMARSVMGTKEFNPDIEPAQYLIFDIQFLGNECLRNKPFEQRRKILMNHLSKVNEQVETLETTLYTSTLCIPRQFPLSHAKQLYLSIIADKGEGIMLKHKQEKYAKSWTKVKKVFTIDAFVIGIEKGKGKFMGQIGALKLGVMQGDQVIGIGKCSGMVDNKRKELTQKAIDKTLLHTVIEVKANEVTKNLKLRHPNYARERYDKDWKECSIEQLKEHLK